MDISTIDISDIISETEYSLRSIIKKSLEKKFGSDWISQCGVKPDKIVIWENYKKKEIGNLGQPLEDSNFYYSDLADLVCIINKNWNEFEKIFIDKEKIKFWFSEIISFRNALSHRRKLTPYQKCRAIGYTGEIRSKIAEYRNMIEKKENYFPIIERVKDNFNNKIEGSNNSFNVSRLLNVGVELIFDVDAIDPLGEQLEYGLSFSGQQQVWQKSNILRYKLSEQNLGRCQVEIKIKSQRSYHYNNQGGWDDISIFVYTIVPFK